MGGASIEYHIDGARDAAGPAIMAVVRERVRSCDRGGEFAGAIDWMLEDAAFELADDGVDIYFSGAAGTTQNLAEAAAHVVNATVHYDRARIDEALASVDCRLTEVGLGTGGSSLTDRYLAWDTVIAQLCFAARVEDDWRPKSDFLGEVTWTEGADKPTAISAPEEFAHAEDLGAPASQLYYTFDAHSEDDPGSGWVSDLPAQQRDQMMQFWRGGVCLCPICVAHTPAQVPAAQTVAVAALDRGLADLGLDRERFRLRWHPVRNVWAVVFIFDDGDGRELSAIPFTSDGERAIASTRTALVHAWVQPCTACAKRVLTATGDDLVCPGCGSRHPARELYRQFVDAAS